MLHLLLRMIPGCLFFFTVIISGALALGHLIEADIFIYQQGFGHASTSYILDLEGTTGFRISNTDYASYPAYSPDGQQLAYFVYGDEALSLHVANRNSAAGQLLLDNVTIANVLSWSPDNQQVAIIRDQETINALAVVDVNTGGTQTIPINEVIRNVLWFSDHELLVMTGFLDRDSERNYYHYDLTSSTWILLDNLSIFIDIALSPDKQEVIGTDNRGNLWLWHRDTDERRILVTHGAIIGNPTWSQDGEYVAYNVALGNGLHGLYVFTLATDEEHEVLHGVGRIFSILFLPDNRLIFIRGDVVTRAINIVNLDGTGLRKLITETDEVSSHIIWRP